MLIMMVNSQPGVIQQVQKCAVTSTYAFAGSVLLHLQPKRLCMLSHVASAGVHGQLSSSTVRVTMSAHLRQILPAGQERKHEGKQEQRFSEEHKFVDAVAGCRRDGP